MLIFRQSRKSIMAPSKKSRSVNKKLSNVREAASSKDKNAENASKNKQKASPQKVNLFLNFFGKNFLSYTCSQLK